MHPIDRFLAEYPDAIQSIAGELRTLVRRSVSDSIERLRPGWRLIGYNVPVRRGQRYFAYVAPEVQHIHLGFEYGTLLDDPERLLHGSELRLRQVRYLTFRPGEQLPREAIVELIRGAARVAAMTRAERSSLALVRALSSGSPTPAR